MLVPLRICTGLGYLHVTPSFVVPDDLEPLTRHPKAARPGEPTRVHNPHCFGCGPDAPGLRLEVFARAGFETTAILTVQPWMEGGPGIIHGGLLTTAFDDVMSLATFLAGPPTVTGHLEVDFLAPIPVGARLQLHATALGRQRRKVFTEATASIDGATVARAHAIFIVIDIRDHYADHLEKSQLSDEHKAKMARPRT